MTEKNVNMIDQKEVRHDSFHVRKSDSYIQSGYSQDIEISIIFQDSQ